VGHRQQAERRREVERLGAQARGPQGGVAQVRLAQEDVPQEERVAQEDDLAEELVAQEERFAQGSAAARERRPHAASHEPALGGRL
jgi:hypothetical protein